MGIGGKDTLDMPSAMFTAQVSCVGCHTHLTPEGEPMSRQEKKEAQRASCVMCHGEGYDLVFDNWLSGERTVLKEYRSWLARVKQDYRTIGGSRKKRNMVRRALAKAEDNYNFVREGHMPHNIRYALYLLNASAKRVETAMKAIKRTYRMPSPGESLKPENSCVTFCHGNRKPAEFVNYNGQELPHQMHIEEMELSCNACHSVQEHGKVAIDKSVCADCHDDE
ncbi:MAG: hypothetical protein D6800_14155 [Candidatus Zixiibacteriota bacterium]|nr:MAG: hypothetical protein D6800_14155 [candidate division Zixibacteria bacterium]